MDKKLFAKRLNSAQKKIYMYIYIYIFYIYFFFVWIKNLYEQQFYEMGGWYCEYEWGGIMNVLWDGIMNIEGAWY